MKNIIEWACIAFIVGALFILGGKTVEYIWPTEPIRLEVVPVNQHHSNDGKEAVG